MNSDDVFGFRNAPCQRLDSAAPDVSETFDMRGNKLNRTSASPSLAGAQLTNGSSGSEGNSAQGGRRILNRASEAEDEGVEGSHGRADVGEDWPTEWRGGEGGRACAVAGASLAQRRNRGLKLTLSESEWGLGGGMGPNGDLRGRQAAAGRVERARTTESDAGEGAGCFAAAW
ncbi:hypothetical protein K505DRAFT_391158 [Melanomma pulvis-pyrius CBS 109.77]|uniref:Uncharacterized protein n=1 Tax=Melanomma pulvis-pyrius CBS 109.77 TaxID=1314802 RepID=A0A6A6X1L4_9PLEO|nr:hypothetical protein K505DRAFT_391158 [Melanomma pulvis-pyrius CBS 109.77]